MRSSYVVVEWKNMKRMEKMKIFLFESHNNLSDHSFACFLVRAAVCCCFHLVFLTNLINLSCFIFGISLVLFSSPRHISSPCMYVHTHNLDSYLVSGNSLRDSFVLEFMWSFVFGFCMNISRKYLFFHPEKVTHSLIRKHERFYALRQWWIVKTKN